MKRSIIVLSILVAGLALAPATMADDRRDGERRHEYGHDYRGHHGYRNRPYERNRHYRRDGHRQHRYDYHGHWRSWGDFEHYMRRNPHLRRHGHYYHDGVHLMFRTCPPDTGMCIFFSIGR